MARLLLHIYGHQNGNRRRSSRAWKYAAVFNCKYGQPCNSLVCSIDFCTAFRHHICLDSRTGRLACQLCHFLCGTEKILAEGFFDLEISINKTGFPYIWGKPVLFIIKLYKCSYNNINTFLVLF